MFIHSSDSAYCYTFLSSTVCLSVCLVICHIHTLFKLTDLCAIWGDLVVEPQPKHAVANCCWYLDVDSTFYQINLMLVWLIIRGGV